MNSYTNFEINNEPHTYQSNYYAIFTETIIIKAVHTMSNESIERNKPEIIIGLIYAAGTDMKKFIDEFKYKIHHADYNVHEIKISKYFDESIDNKNEIDRINKCIDFANEEVKEKCKLTKSSYKNGYFAAKAVKEIRAIREREKEKEKTKNNIYIISSLKREDELKLLRKIYGRNLVLITLYQDEKERKSHLKQLSEIDTTDEKIIDLLERDQNEDIDHGQKIRKIFWKSHYFINISKNFSNETNRMIEILFSAPYITPTRVEYAMCVAHTTAWRSADPNRQVGAVICDNDGNIISSGCNDTPKFGGGTYWEGDYPDFRDFNITDRDNNTFNSKEKNKIIDDIVQKCEAENFRRTDINDLKKILESSKIKELIENYRSAHAEEAAICDAALRGVSIRNATLVCTTFPCHLCCKKIIASGISRVVFIEPYPKSKNKEFYSDQISVDELNNQIHEKKIIFEQFVGVSPRRYNYAFKTEFKDKRVENESIVNWSLDHTKIPKFLYDRETINYALRELKELVNFGILNQKKFNSEAKKFIDSIYGEKKEK